MYRLIAAAALAALATPAHAVIVLNNASGYLQDFNTLAVTGTSSALPLGVLIAETGANADGLYAAGTGSGNAGDTYSFGAAGSGDRALGGLRSGSLIPLFGLAFTNNTGSAITALNIAFTGEQWRLGTLGRVDRLDFQYAIGTTTLTSGNFIDANTLDFTAPVTSGAVGALNGNAAANRVGVVSTISGLTIANGQSFVLRFTDLDATGADDGLAIDDFSLTPTLANVTPGAVPEPSTWAMMIAGFGVIGGAMRRRARRGLSAA